MEKTIFPPLSRERVIAITAQWQHFQAGLPADQAIIRPVILRSWQRCRAAGFPGGALEPCPIDEDALRRAVAAKRDLVESAKLLMDKLVLSIHMSKSVVTLVDDTGLVLHVSATIQDLENVPYGAPGRRCDEATLGTNGMGVCIIEKKPVHVIASEHFNASLHYLSCAAAPIIGGDGQLSRGAQPGHQHRELPPAHPGAGGGGRPCRGGAPAAAQPAAGNTRPSSNCSTTASSCSAATAPSPASTARPATCSAWARRLAGKNIQTCIRASDVLKTILADRKTFLDREVSFVLRGRDPVLRPVVRAVRRRRRHPDPARGPAHAQVRRPGGRGQGRLHLRQHRRGFQRPARGHPPGPGGLPKRRHHPCCSANPARARNSSPRPSTTPATGARVPSWWSTAGRCPATWCKANCSAMWPAPFPARSRRAAPANSNWPDGGTIFLDEIGEMSLEAQVSLLRLPPGKRGHPPRRQAGQAHRRAHHRRHQQGTCPRPSKTRPFAATSTTA